MSWKTEKLGNLLSESKILCDNPNPNRRIRVKLNVAGVEKRPLKNEIEDATKQFIRKAGQFIYGKQNLHKGAFGIIPDFLDGYESSADIPSFDIRKDCLPDWIFYYFKSGNRYQELEKIARGVGSKRIHPEQLFEIDILLPEIEIQKQIISRIHQLEKNTNVLSEEILHQANFIPQVRQAFLRDAMQGKLVPQDSNDEPASELLKRIKEEKSKLIAEGKLKKQKPLPEIKPEEIPYEIPSTWVWCRLGEITTDLRYGTSEKAELYGEIPILRMGNIIANGEILYSNLKYVSSSIPDLPEMYLEKGDLIFNRTNSYELVGKCAVFNNGAKYTLASYLIRVRFHLEISSKFISDYINSTICRTTQLEPNIIQQNGQANFNGTKLANILIPLPPFTEQQRIVSKLNELMQFCDQLEQSINTTKEQTNLLLQTVLREALKPGERINE